jgi:predicted TIM-barrel fold metal-dependent hydrolase
LTELLLEYSDVNIVLLHMDDPINSIFLAKRFSNVFLETSWIDRKWHNLAPVKIALDSVDNSKIFFGTDFPYGFSVNTTADAGEFPRTYENIVSTYNELLPKPIAADVLYWNARRFLEQYGIDFKD